MGGTSTQSTLQLQVASKGSLHLGVVEVAGEVWFHAPSLVAALQSKEPDDFLHKIPDDEKRVDKLRTGGATTYREIRKDRFADAVAFVKREMAILRNMKSAPRKDDEWHVKKIGAIKARCKNQFGGVDVYKPYIKKNFGATSLTDLSTDDLQKTYAHVMKKKVA